jgi:small conductance mechanosensitive channel
MIAVSLGNNFGRDVLQRSLQIGLILGGTLLFARLGARAVRRSVHGLVTRSSAKGELSPRAAGRAETLAAVAASTVRIVVWTISVLLLIDRIGINPGPVLAGASIVGVAVGFGAQSLVKDFLSGFFVLAEDQFGIGDVVTVSDVTGTVEDVNLRITRLRSTDGTVWYVPNGEIRKVGNAAKEWARAIVDVVIPIQADVSVATGAIADEVARLAAEPAWSGAVLDPPEVLGVESIGPDGATLRVAARTKPDERAHVARELRARIGARLRREGISPVREPASPAPPAAADD